MAATVTALNPPTHAPSLTTRAMLVRLNISLWTGRKTDKKISAEVAANHNADRSMGNYSRRLVASQATKRLGAAASAARAIFYSDTLPWQDEGERLLPARNFHAFSAQVRKLAREFDSAADEFAAAYPQIVADAQILLGDMFAASDYPHQSRIREKFSLSSTVNPLPQAGDFRISLGDGEVDRIRDEIEARNAAALERANRDLWQRIHDGVQTLRDRVSSYQADPETGAIISTFRDSIFHQLREMVDLLPRLNVTDDADLSRMIQRLDDTLVTGGDTPDAIRQDAKIRANTIAQADAILADMAGYID